MKAVFSVAGDQPFPDTTNYDITVCFNGLPGVVILEVHEITFEGFSGEGDNPETSHTKKSVCVMRASLQASHARAIASALLSAATETKRAR